MRNFIDDANFLREICLFGAKWLLFAATKVDGSSFLGLAVAFLGLESLKSFATSGCVHALISSYVPEKTISQPSTMTTRAAELSS